MFPSTTSTTHLGENINNTHHAWELMSAVEWVYLSSTGETCWVLTVPAKRKEQSKRGWAQAWSNSDTDPKQSVDFGLINQLFTWTGTFLVLAGVRSRCRHGSKAARAAPGHAAARLPMADALSFSGVTQLQPLCIVVPSWCPCCPWVALSCQLETGLNEAVVRHSLQGSSPLRLLQLPVVSTLIRKENSFPQSGLQPTVCACIFPWQLVFLLLMAQSPVKSVS